MASGFCFGVFYVFCLVAVPTVWAEYCTYYWDINNEFHDVEQCSKYCCGDCYERYCCSSKGKQITLQQQEQCHQSTPNNSINIGVILGIVAGAIIFIVICVILICCISPCCLIYKQRRNKLNQRQTTAPNTTVHTPPPPPPPHPSTGHQPTHQGYHSVPGYEGPPTPTAPPPSYLECTAPGYQGGAFTQGQPMYPLQPPSQPTAPPHPDLDVHPPYNPSDGTDS